MAASGDNPSHNYHPNHDHNYHPDHDHNYYPDHNHNYHSDYNHNYHPNHNHNYYSNHNYNYHSNHNDYIHNYNHIHDHNYIHNYNYSDHNHNNYNHNHYPNPCLCNMYFRPGDDGCLTLIAVCPASPGGGQTFMFFNDGLGGPVSPGNGEITATLNCVNGNWIFGTDTITSVTCLGG
ncbi:hypothetical protein FO519_009396 [Halicephalobus sp. NKZ332]|nr:hypothetical protein FO519_009396 [Halicephalobus sp. NKZ332]